MAVGCFFFNNSYLLTFRLVSWFIISLKAPFPLCDLVGLSLSLWIVFLPSDTVSGHSTSSWLSGSITNRDTACMQFALGFLNRWISFALVFCFLLRALHCISLLSHTLKSDTSIFSNNANGSSVDLFRAQNAVCRAVKLQGKPGCVSSTLEIK